MGIRELILPVTGILLLLFASIFFPPVAEITIPFISAVSLPLAIGLFLLGGLLIVQQFIRTEQDEEQDHYKRIAKDQAKRIQELWAKLEKYEHGTQPPETEWKLEPNIKEDEGVIQRLIDEIQALKYGAKKIGKTSEKRKTDLIGLFYCAKCDVEIIGTDIFQCSICRKVFCADHKVPESHGCVKLEKPIGGLREIHHASGSIEAKGK